MKSSAAVIQQEFDALAPVYESNRLAEWYKAHSEEIVAMAVIAGKGDVLDIGCGSGYLLRRMSRKFPDARCVGIDLAPAMVTQARRMAEMEGAQKLEFLPGDWENLDEQVREKLARYKFMLVICANAFHYFSEPQQAARDIFNLMQEGGTLLVLEREKSRSLLTWAWDILHRYFIKDHVEFYTASDLAKCFEQAGFSQVKIIKTIKRYFWKGKLFTSIALLECYKPTREEVVTQ